MVLTPKAFGKSFIRQKKVLLLYYIFTVSLISQHKIKDLQTIYKRKSKKNETI